MELTRETLKEHRLNATKNGTRPVITLMNPDGELSRFDLFAAEVDEYVDNLAANNIPISPARDFNVDLNDPVSMNAYLKQFGINDENDVDNMLRNFGIDPDNIDMSKVIDILLGDIPDDMKVYIDKVHRNVGLEKIDKTDEVLRDADDAELDAMQTALDSLNNKKYLDPVGDLLTAIGSVSKFDCELPIRDMEKIYHYRYSLGVSEIDNNNMGGATIVYEVKDDMLRVGWSVCSDYDNFNRALGVRIARGRMKRAKPFHLHEVVEHFNPQGILPKYAILLNDQVPKRYRNGVLDPRHFSFTN